MLLLGCLLAFSIAVAPRLVLILAWIFSDRWQVVWQGEWLIPLLGIIFLPFTTVMYMLTWTFNSGIEGWDWLWIILGVVMDIGKWGQILANRKEATAQVQNYYPSGAAGGTAASAAPEPAAPATTHAPAEPAPTSQPEPAAAPEPPAAPEPAAPPDDAGSKLADLDKLHRDGVLTDEEYAAAKTRLEG